MELYRALAQMVGAPPSTYPGGTSLGEDRQRRQAGRPRAALDAQQIHLLVNTAREHLGDEFGRYRSGCQELPLLLRRSGLAAVLLWHQKRAAKRKNQMPPGATAEHWIAGQLAWTLLPLLNGDAAPAGGYSWAKPGDAFLDEVQQALQQADLAHYITLSRRALALSDWFRLFANSLDAGDEDPTDPEAAS